LWHAAFSFLVVVLIYFFLLTARLGLKCDESVNVIFLP